MMTIGKLARTFGLSRSTLLYYDRIGLLKPSGRTPANYRTYSDKDIRRLEKICLYRKAGLGLDTIASTLNAGRGSLAEVLEEQLSSLNHRISALRQQQHLIVSLLKGMASGNTARVLDKSHWVQLLRAAGMDDEGMIAWHRAFERLSPEAHHHFLLSLGLSDEEVSALRRRAEVGSDNAGKV